MSEIVEYEDGIDTSDRFTYTIEGENTLNASIDGDTMTIPKGADGGIYTLTVNAVEKESQSTLASINKYGHSPFTTNISIIMYDIGDTQTGKNIQIDENGPLMLADKVIDIKVMDAGGNSFGSSSHGTRLNNYGSNYWGDSNIRSWLNSDAAAGMVDWPCGKPPSQYSGEAGFLTNFTPDELGAIKEVSQKAILASCDVDENNQPKWYTVGENFTGTEPFELVENIEDVTANYDNAYAEYITDKMFLPDVKQLYTVYEIFGDDYYAGAYNLQDENSDKVSYWLRTPKANSVGGQRKADPNGAVTETPANANGIGVRPAFYLNTQSVGFKSGDGTTENPYSVRRNVFGGEDPIEIRATYGYENRIIDNLSKYMAYADGHSTANEFTYTIEGENTVGASINGDTLTVPTGLEPGEYPLTVKAVENEPKYTLASIYKYGSAPVMLNIKVIIQKLEPEMTVTGKSLSYTGSAQELVTGTAKGGTLVYSLSENGDYSEKVATAVSAGNYTVWYKVIGDATHNDSEPQSVTASIAKVTAAATVKANELVFKNRDQYLVTGKTNDGTLVYSTSENGEYSEKIPTGKDVGDYTVWYKVIGDSNHTDSAPRATTASIKNIVGISIEKKPINTTIIEGMPFDASGLKVTADCGDGETFEVLGYTLSGYDTSKVGEQTVTVTYAGKTAEFKITVEAKSMTNIELTHRPDKLTYYQGDALDIAGMVITAFYNNNTSEFINNSDCTVSGSADNVGEQTVTVTYNGQTVKFTVTVLERPVETQTVETPLIETADFYGGKRAIISCATDGADIYYTTDGSDPTTASEKYAAPIELTESAEIKAVAVKSDMNDSAVSGKTVTVERVAAPVASLTGEVEVGTTVSLLSSTAGAEIYYTFGDSLDETNYKKYTDEIVITGSTKIRAVAAKRGYAQSEGVTFEYTIAPPEEEEEPSETNRALLDAGETMCKAGNTFSLPAYIYSEKAVSDFRYTLSFDSDKFEYIGFEAGEDVPASAVSVTANENNVTVRGAVDGLTAAEACVLIFKAKSDVEADDYLLPVDDIDINTADNSLTDIWYLDGLVSIIPEGTSITASAFLSDADDNIIENTEDVKGNVTAWILAETAEEMPEGGEPISFDIILAFYDTNGALVKVDTLEAELSGEMDLFEKEISIPENTEIGDVKLMVWDNTGTMKPLMEATPVVHPYGYELGE